MAPPNRGQGKPVTPEELDAQVEDMLQVPDPNEHPEPEPEP